MEKKALLKEILLAYTRNMNLFHTMQSNFDSKLALYKRRRKHNLLIIQQLRQKQLLLLAALQQSATKRSLWKLNRESDFWEVQCKYNGDDFFKSHFHMNRASFEALCSLLGNLSKTDSNCRSAVPLEKRVAIALFALCSSENYKVVSELFGVGKSTACIILIEFCKEVWKSMSKHYINKLPPTQESVTECLDGFQRLGFPQCLGVIDACHIEVIPSPDVATDYLNMNYWYSIVLLALVDYRHRFLYIHVGAAGGCTSLEIYDASNLKQLLTDDEILMANKRDLNGVQVPVYILGNSAFTLSSTLMKPYYLALTEAQILFNYKLSDCREEGDRAFSELKARFRRIAKGVDNRNRNAPMIVRACCVLHNFLIERNDTFDYEWLQKLQEFERNRENPRDIAEIDDDNESHAEVIRQTLCHYISSNVNTDVDGRAGDCGTGGCGGGGDDEDAGGGEPGDSNGVNNDGCDVME